MMRALVFAALTLAACGAQPASQHPAAAPEDQRPENVPSTDDAGQPPPALAAPSNLPRRARVYPDAIIEQSHSANPDSSPGGHVIFRTPASPETVAEHYREQLGNVSTAQSGATTLLSSGPSEGDGGIDVSIAPAAEGGSRVRISFRPAAR